MSPVLPLIGFVAGLLTIASPCILPVLPAVIASGLTNGGRRHAAMIATGLATTFAGSALLSIRVLQALHLPLGLRYDLAIVVLFALAAGFMFPTVGQLLERPFARLVRGRGAVSGRGGLLLGASLGMLYLPCGGPILATIAAVGAPGRALGVDAVLLTGAYAVGIAIPMFALITIAGRAAAATNWVRSHASAVRRTGGVLLGGSAVAITFGAATSLQTAIPGYASAIENRLVGHGSVAADLTRIGERHESTQAKLVHRAVTAPQPQAAAGPIDEIPTISARALPQYGAAPDFVGVTRWLNTTHGAPLTLAAVRGKVVLIDFWTYSCINCLRSLPHVKEWYDRYRTAGLVVVGVHTPEFDFEHEPGNVIAAVRRLGVRYPVAVDNHYGTWSAWGNNSWPAEYLIDRTGQVRYGSIGEGDYGAMEGAIRALLAQAGTDLPDPTTVADATPTAPSTPETYLGYQRLARYDGDAIARDTPRSYTPVASVAADHLTYGGTWTIHADDIEAGADAAITINVNAQDVYLVLAGSGTVTGTFDGASIRAQRVAGSPSLYTLVSLPQRQRGVLQLSLTSGIRAYDFTFG